MTHPNPIHWRGIGAAFASPIFLGMAPIFGKIAITAGADGFTVAALRTIIAVLMLWSVYLLFFRRYIFIYPAGLLGCIIIGAINGVGSLFYYGGLELLDASMVQLINGSYLAFAVLLARIGGQQANKRTVLRIILAMIALVMITGFSGHSMSWLGVGLMLANALMFAATVILSQYILYEMPSLTFTLYTLTTMGVVVTMVWLAISPPLTSTLLEATFLPVLLLGITTALSRLAMFASVKFLGGMQTAILGITEIAVALLLAAAVLGESLTTGQWMGTVLLFTSILLMRQQDMLPHGFNPNALIVTNMASVQFQRIAFHRAFGTHETDNEHGTMSALTTQEMLAIQRMMGASSGAIDPFPIGRARQNPGYDSQEVLEQILNSDPTSQPPEPPNL
ncbi:DMT family transporter [Phototrophicus methaneseepsis]|uniref:DMT family transporter n=1 Tax=Phototrophicus methaneseepsis TaxID=2710758 RepID=A0A7S8E8W3_9CHLR|nr:DMT family transporter [Phototrophicus methaneseepsis]QPC82399.1 DMT family transporter [Phototrophicus methaneseepsis]